MLCLTLLLAFQNPLPEIGSPAAEEADSAYRSWADGLSIPPVTPAHMEYAFSASVTMPMDGQPVMFQVDCDVEVDFQSLHRFRYLLQGTARLDATDQVDFHGEILFDGETIWAHGRVDSESIELHEEGMIRCDQQMLEDGYLQLLVALPKMLEAPELKELGLQEMFRGMTELLPPDIGTYMHPAGYMYFASKSLTCRRYQENENSLDLDLTLDTRPESILGSLLAMVHELEGTDALTESDRSEFMVLQDFAEQGAVHLRQDRATGIPLAMEISFVLAPELLDPEGTDGLEGPLQMSISLLGSLDFPESIDAALFATPRAYERTIDVTPFLQMGLGSLQTALDEMESEQDMEF